MEYAGENEQEEVVGNTIDEVGSSCTVEMECPWVDHGGGDFNVVARSEERMGISDSIYGRSDMADFKAFLSNLSLIEPPAVGKKYTWFRPNGQAASRLDRFLLSSDWCSCWPHGVQTVMARSLSDHCPVMFRSTDMNWGPRPFRVLNCWFSDPGFKAFVEKEWQGFQVQGSGGFQVQGSGG
ncbi:uncharacterized protein LOC130715790 [Lotus japonicus]|uniref:uncharacterized protein LOC130715790 n=1 Tax=Lotus japonicus TaxID=34305 RepID=UPI00258C17D7|nr:uncharacterized protein LOC130715790 [Lotus japonicus]